MFMEEEKQFWNASIKVSEVTSSIIYSGQCCNAILVTVGNGIAKFAQYFASQLKFDYGIALRREL